MKNYRPEIDGLRAIAILLVMLFHLDVGVSGGFVGVDIFFVISGYVITQSICGDMAEGKFRLADFWVRRIRRIVPAAVVISLVVLVAGYFVLLPNDYGDLGASAIAQQLIVSNFYFWRTTGYFDGPAELKPLLHTWSLSVEEQFYLVYPILLLLLNRWCQRWTMAVLGLGAVGSLLVSEYGVRHHAGATFYLMPTRGWEFLVGGLVWFAPRPARCGTRLLESISWLSLFTIILAGCLFNRTLPFPGLAALVPCVAAGLLIYVNGVVRTWAASILAARPVVFIGLISYSLYLWHWPVLVYARYCYGSEWTSGGKLVLLLVTFVLAVVSWRYVETPLRKRSGVDPNGLAVFGTALSVLSVVMLVGWLVIVNDGFPQRFPREASAYLQVARTEHYLEMSESQIVEGKIPTWPVGEGVKPAVLVWGDSHAMSIMPGVVGACEELGLVCGQVTHSNTPPLLGFESGELHSGQQSPSFNDAVLSYIERESIAVVVLSASWARYAELDTFERAMRRTVSRLVELGVRVVIVKDYPCGEELSPRRVLLRSLAGEDPKRIGMRLVDHQRLNARADKILDEQESELVRVVDPAPYFVDREGFCRAERSGQPLYYDAGHLTRAGGALLRPVFMPVLRLP